MNRQPNSVEIDCVNQRVSQLIESVCAGNPKSRTSIAGMIATEIAGAIVLDAGIDTSSSLESGLLLARICLGDLASVSIHSCDWNLYSTDQAIFVRTDRPLLSCLGCQYAGWPVQTDDFFAMGSGPMRLLRGREEVLVEQKLTESSDVVAGVLESDKLPTESAIEFIAKECGVETAKVRIAVAPSTSIAGSVQVVARSVETAMHKLHAIGFDMTSVVSGTGFAPLPPPAKPGNMVAGIGRTNDAILYGATVAFWVDATDEAIESVIEKIPSGASKDHGRPFADVFKDYEYDFYKVDPLLFSPAIVTVHNLRTGKTFRAGATDRDVLRDSFLS